MVFHSRITNNVLFACQQDYDSFLSKFYRTYPRIQGNHIFSCEHRDIRYNKNGVFVTIKEADIDSAKTSRFNAIKTTWEGRKDFPKGQRGYSQSIPFRRRYMIDEPIETIPPPGLNPYKRV